MTKKKTKIIIDGKKFVRFHLLVLFLGLLGIGFLATAAIAQQEKLLVQLVVTLGFIGFGLIVIAIWMITMTLNPNDDRFVKVKE